MSRVFQLKKEGIRSIKGIIMIERQVIKQIRSITQQNRCGIRS
ncbi:hypothetical protein [Bacillus sp. CH30_1T]|nr:hypothetical protein [Bacillus sp. CH30_1T]